MQTKEEVRAEIVVLYEELETPGLTSLRKSEIKAEIRQLKVELGKMK